MVQPLTETVVPALQLWLLDAAVHVAAVVAWVVVLYITYRTVGYVRTEFLGATTDGSSRSVPDTDD
jgi:uncharacterized membrane protein